MNEKYLKNLKSDYNVIALFSIVNVVLMFFSVPVFFPIGFQINYFLTYILFPSLKEDLSSIILGVFTVLLSLSIVVISKYLSKEKKWLFFLGGFIYFIDTLLVLFSFVANSFSKEVIIDVLFHIGMMTFIISNSVRYFKSLPKVS